MYPHSPAGCAQTVQMYVPRNVCGEVDFAGRQVYFMPACSDFPDEAVRDQTVAVRQVIGEHGRSRDDEDSQRHDVQLGWRQGMLNLRQLPGPDVA